MKVGFSSEHSRRGLYHVEGTRVPDSPGIFLSANPFLVTWVLSDAIRLPHPRSISPGLWATHPLLQPHQYNNLRSSSVRHPLRAIGQMPNRIILPPCLQFVAINQGHHSPAHLKALTAHLIYPPIRRVLQKWQVALLMVYIGRGTRADDWFSSRPLQGTITGRTPQQVRAQRHRCSRHAFGQRA